MSDRSFIEIWSLSYDDIAWVESFNRSSRVWAALQLRFFRRHGRFPSRDGDLDGDSLRYLAEQLGLPVPDPTEFRFGHVNACRQRSSILRHLQVRRATDRDRRDLRAWMTSRCGGSAGRVEDQMAEAYRHCLESRIFIPSDKIMERLVRGARHDFIEGLLAKIAARLPEGTKEQLEACLSEPRASTGFLSLKNDVGAASLKNILAACDRVAFIEVTCPYFQGHS